MTSDARKALADKIAGIPIGPFAILLGMNDDLHFSEIVAARNMIVAALHYEANALAPLPGTREEVARAEDNEHPNVASGLFARETEDQAKALPPAPMPEWEGMREALKAATCELENLFAMVEGEVPSLLRDHHSWTNIVSAIEAGNAALAPHDKTEE